MNEWISCKDRLPKIDETVLMQDEYGDMHVAHLVGGGYRYVVAQKFLEPEHWVWNDDLEQWDGCTDLEEAVAWMPLPDPYKEE